MGQYGRPNLALAGLLVHDVSLLLAMTLPYLRQCLTLCFFAFSFYRNPFIVNIYTSASKLISLPVLDVTAEPSMSNVRLVKEFVCLISLSG